MQSFELKNNAALQEVLAAMETERKRIAAAQARGYIVIALGLLLLLAAFGYGIPAAGIVAFIALCITGGVLLYRISAALRTYKESYKRDVIGAALKSFDASLTIRPYEGIAEQEFDRSQLYTRSPDRYNTEDLVSGTAGKTSFYFAEVHAEYKTEYQTKNGRRTEWHDIFKGIIFVADFNKNFKGITCIRPKDWESAIGAWLSKNIFSSGKRDVVTLENADFDKTFVTYSTNQVEARYILTPAMMERIVHLNRRAEYALSLSFNNSRMYIGFPMSRNHFEPPVFRTLLNPQLLEEDTATIGFMYDIVRELDLNTRIWGKD